MSQWKPLCSTSRWKLTFYSALHLSLPLPLSSSPSPSASVAGARVPEELRAAHRRRPPKPGARGENGVAYRAGHAAGARHHAGHQRQAGEWSGSTNEFSQRVSIAPQGQNLQQRT